MKADILIVIVGMGIVTYIPRWLPLILLSRRKLPSWLIEWLDFIPVAILSSLILPALLIDGEPRKLDFMRPHLLVALPTFLFAVMTKSLAGTVIIGMVLFWLAGKFL